MSGKMTKKERILKLLMESSENGISVNEIAEKGLSTVSSAYPVISSLRKEYLIELDNGRYYYQGEKSKKETKRSRSNNIIPKKNNNWNDIADADELAIYKMMTPDDQSEYFKLRQTEEYSREKRILLVKSYLNTFNFLKGAK